MEHRRAPLRPRGSWRTAFLAVALLGCGGQGESMVTQRLAVDLLEEGRFAAEDGERGSVGVITPALSQGENVADQLALLCPPGVSLVTTLGPDTPSGSLAGSFGVHFKATRALAKAGLSRLEVAWSVEVLDQRGAMVAQRVGVTTVHARGADQVHDRSIPINEWAPLGGASLPVEAGSVIRARAEVQGPTAGPTAGLPLESLRMGFGELRVVTEREVPRTRASADRPNLILVVMDTQRADRTTPYGYDRPTTPRLEELAARGIVYEQAWSPAPWTWPSTASLMTGLDPIEHGVVDQRTGFLPHQLTTLAESLQDAGLTTGGFSGNPLVTEDHNFQQGFEHFQAARESVKGDQVVPDALAWLDRNRKHRFFLYVHLQDPHLPHKTRPEDMRAFTGSARPQFPPMAMQERAFGIQLTASEGKDGLPDGRALVPQPMERWFSDAYDACVHTGDHWLGVLLDQLAAWDLMDSTVIAFTADHGEELLEHQNLAHGHELWPELLHVPLILAGPGIDPGRCATPVSTRLVASTLSRLGGGTALGRRDDPLLVQPDRVVNTPLLSQTSNAYWRGTKDVPLHSLREGRWLLHWAPEHAATWGEEDPSGQGTVRLFDLEEDPGAHRDLAADQPERAQALLDGLRSLLAEQHPLARGQGLRAGAGTSAAMQAIGYAGQDEGEGGR